MRNAKLASWPNLEMSPGRNVSDIPIFAESAMMGMAHRGAMRGNTMNQAKVIGRAVMMTAAASLNLVRMSLWLLPRREDS